MLKFLIRPMRKRDIPGIARVQVDSYRSAYKDLFPPSYLEMFSYEEQEKDWQKWFDNREKEILWGIVDPEDQVHGYCLASYREGLTQGYDAEVIALHLLPVWKGQGFGKLLLFTTLRTLFYFGCRSVMLWTLQGNPIRAWYEKLGGTLIGEKRDWWDDWEMVEVAYGWPDMAALLQRLNLHESALLVVDVQQGLFQKSTPIRKAEALLENIAQLVKRANDAWVPIFFIQHATEKVLVHGTPEWQLHPQLQPGRLDRLVEKHHGNAFQDTSLQAQLDALGVRRVVVCGLVSHGCVRATCLGALELGYTVELASDAHSSYARGAAKKIEQVNQELQALGVQVLPSSEVHL